MTLDRIVVWFSCGAASAAAAKLTVERYGAESVRVVNNPVAEEDADNRRFLKDVERWIGVPVEIATNPKFASASAADVWAKRRFMSGPHGAPCTTELKINVRQQWEATEKPNWHVLGFTVDELTRHARFVQSERENVLPVLIDAGMTKDDCAVMVRAAGIELPRIYGMGYPNANCVGCVKATSPTYWNHVRRSHPVIFAERAAESRRLGARLVRVAGERIFLDELDPEAMGQPMKTVAVDCGIFCEEPA